MSYRIVLDSSSNIFSMAGGHFGSAPLTITIDGQEFPDAPGIDMGSFNKALDEAYAAGKPCSSACPSPESFINAFGDADEVYCITITHNLSGSFNSAAAAKDIYEEQHPGRHVYLIDSLATAGRMLLMHDFLKSLLDRGINGEEAVKKTCEYRDSHTVLMFTLQSIKRLSSTGRVNPLLVKAIGMLDLRLIGVASSVGTIELTGKHRGASKVLKGTFDQMLKKGYKGGRVVISHYDNIEDASGLKSLILKKFGHTTDVIVQPTTALCSFYAEKYGYITGFEI